MARYNEIWERFDQSYEKECTCGTNMTFQVFFANEIQTEVVGFSVENYETGIVTCRPPRKYWNAKGIMRMPESVYCQTCRKIHRTATFRHSN